MSLFIWGDTGEKTLFLFVFVNAGGVMLGRHKSVALSAQSFHLDIQRRLRQHTASLLMSM